MFKLRMRLLLYMMGVYGMAVFAALVGHDLMMRHDMAGIFQVLGALTFLFALAGWGLWIVVNKWVLKPIEELHRSDVLIEQGDLEGAHVAVSDQQPGELSELLRNRNMMLLELIEQRKAARENERRARLAAIGQLAAGIAHDFNNALTVILGFVELMKMDAPAGPWVDDACRVEVAAHRASQLVKQMLDFSRKSVQQRRPVNLGQLVQESLGLLERALPETIRLEKRVSNERLTAEVDAGQIEQVLTNLALNARDAMPKGGGLRISLARMHVDGSTCPPAEGMKPGDWIVLSIADTGTGIPVEALEHIFEPFFTTKDIGKGTGLGLAQVYGIVRQHGGFIKVSSEMGRGTEFTVYLEASEQEPMSSDSAGAIVRGSGELVLVVEDEAEVRLALRQVLTRLGFRVETADSGLQAMELLTGVLQDCRLVLSDVVMPKMTGGELIEQLRSAGQDMPVVLMSGYPFALGGSPQDVGAAGFLQKPIEISSLSTALNAVLGASRPDGTQARVAARGFGVARAN